ncbi:hypothetical protein XENTR_v10000319 [Xenopus tropicalis]|nr:hypothetical protein XENTR_v10000319 [Xenopus tropicalis]
MGVAASKKVTCNKMVTQHPHFAHFSTFRKFPGSFTNFLAKRNRKDLLITIQMFCIAPNIYCWSMARNIL